MHSPNQTSLWEERTGAVDATAVFRPIHYLGSKLRLIGDICDAVDNIDPLGGPVCDLFAGSGTVSWALSRTRSVTAVDIQEYSRVLCSALLNTEAVPLSVLEGATNVKESGLLRTLVSAVEPLIEHERKSIDDAADSPPDSLCEILDHGSIFASAPKGDASKTTLPFKRAMSAAWSRLEAAGLENSARTVITRYYGGIYFSYLQAAQMDAILDAAHATHPKYRDTAVAMALSTASDAVNTVGNQFAQPLRLQRRDHSVKRHLLNKVKKDRAQDVAAISKRWAERYAGLKRPELPQRALRADYVDFLQTNAESFQVVYADPPYTRDHYSRYYHILETMARRDVPSVSKSNLDTLGLSRGLYRSERHQSPFCIKSLAPSAFARLFQECRRSNVSLVLSYSPYQKGAHPRLMTIDQIVALARESFRRVDVRSAGQFTHSKLNSSARMLAASTEAEVLVVCQCS